MAKPLARLAVLFAVGCSLVLQVANAQSGQVAYADLGRLFLKELGEPVPLALPLLLERHYTRLQLADFDLRVPTSMLTKGEELTRVAAIAGALIDLQERLVDWTITDPGAQKTCRQDLATLRKYVAAWKAKPGTVAPALQPRPTPCQLVLAPTRKQFVGLVGWLGLWKQVYQDYWWIDATAQFSDLRLQDEGQVQILALEYAAPDQHGDVSLGYDMNTREKTGLLQHVLQRAAMSWCWRSLGDDADTTFVLGFATDLVVDVLGQNNARSGGSGKTHSTEGQGGFIPGAPSAGGGMPVQNADSNWRHSLGQDYFARVLRQAQKAGEHEAEGSKDKLGNFLLHDAKGEHKHLVTAPFLGLVAVDREVVPAAFLDDYLEFHRSYRAGFVHWLQTNGVQANAGKTKVASTERFRTLLQRLMAQKQALDEAAQRQAKDPNVAVEKPTLVTFDALCRELYGIPLAERAPDQDTLERRFLAWLIENVR